MSDQGRSDLRRAVLTHPASAPVCADGSVFSRIDAHGRFLTVRPPILLDERMIKIISGYAATAAPRLTEG
jgi:hypothetical protein